MFRSYTVKDLNGFKWSVFKASGDTVDGPISVKVEARAPYGDAARSFVMAKESTKTEVTAAIKVVALGYRGVPARKVAPAVRSPIEAAKAVAAERQAAAGGGGGGLVVLALLALLALSGKRRRR